MKRISKRIVSLFVSVITILTTSVILASPIGATTALTDLPNISGFQVGYKGFGDSPCWVFCNAVSQKVFGVGIPNQPSGYQLNGYNQYWSCVGQLCNSGATNSSVADMLKNKAVSGDLIQYKNSTAPFQHTAIIYDISSYGISIYDDTTSTGIRLINYSWSQVINGGLGNWGGTSGYGISLYHCSLNSASNNNNSTITITGVNYPIKKASGGFFEIFGVITSKYNLVGVGAAVYSNGKCIFEAAKWNQEIKSLNLHDYDSYATFSKLPDGEYTYLVFAQDERGYEARIEKKFTVGGSTTTSGNSPTVLGKHNCDLKPNSSYTWDAGTVKEVATCTESGLKVYTCRECKATKTETIPAKGHTFGNWEIIKEATFNEDGESRRYCSACDAFESQRIPKLDTPGDANKDSKVNLSDVSTILKYIAKWNVEIDINAADVTHDGKVNLADASLLLKYIAKWDVIL